MSTPKFVPAVRKHSLLSKDGQELKIGDVVYQLRTVEDGRYLLEKLFIYEILPDNKLKVHGETKFGSTTYKNDSTLTADMLSLNPKDLVISYLASIQFQMEVMLPRQKESLEKIFDNLSLGTEQTIIEVGEGGLDNLVI